MNFQLANVVHPNSVKNTLPFLVFAEKDSDENLSTALKPYHDPVIELQRCKWNAKQVRTIMFGDNEYLCRCFGLSGASGVRPCLFCLTTKTQVQAPPSSRPAAVSRTLESLKSDYDQFIADGDVFAMRISLTMSFDQHCCRFHWSGCEFLHCILTLGFGCSM